MTTEQVVPDAVPSRAPGTSTTGRFRTMLRSPRAPLFALIAGVALVAGWAVSFAVRVNSWALDETVLRASAVHYLHGLPGSLIHDVSARATSRLYPLVISRFFAGNYGDVAIRDAHVLSVLLFCSTAIPVYLVARRVLRSPWAATLAALLSIAAPWLALSSALFGENLAYPVFVWAIYAMVRAIERPGIVGDLVVIAAVALCTVTRVQLFVLAPVWLITVWLLVYLTRARSLTGARGVRAVAERAWRMAPLTHVLAGFGLLIVAWRWHRGTIHTDFARLAGTYSEFQDRPTLSPDVFGAVVVEVVAFTLPMITAAVASIAWFGATLRGPRVDPRWRFALLAVCVVAGTWLFTAYVQGGFLGPITEERYYIYTFPLLWIGAFAALEEPALVARGLAGAGLLLAALVAATPLPTTPLSAETAFLAPVSTTINSAVGRIIGSIGFARGLSVRDGCTIVVIVAIAVAIACWRRHPRARLVAFIVVPAALQIAVASYAFAARSGHVPGITGVTGGNLAARSWVDHALGHGKHAVFVNNQLRGTDIPSDGSQYSAEFWNPSISSFALDPALNLPGVVPSIAALPGGVDISHDPRTGAVTGLVGTPPIVQEPTSPFLQFAGRRLAASLTDALELLATAPQPRLRWYATGISGDGVVDLHTPVHLTAWPPHAGSRQALRIALSFMGPPSGAGALTVEVGGTSRTIQLPAQEKHGVSFTACPAQGRVTGAIHPTASTALPDGRSAAAILTAVVVRETPAGRC